ncbi:MAG TPA: M23 family metallopeptidase [Thermosynechococcaceae cyanobacterium]
MLPSWADPTADLSSMSFSQLPPITSNGSVQVEGIDRTWQAGQTPDQFLTLGDIQSLQPEAMSIDTISQAIGQQLAATGIGNFQPLAEQDVNSLLQAAPTLGQLQVKDVPALESLFGEKAAGVVDPKTLSSGALEQVVKQFPQLGELRLNAIDMNRFAINSLPGVSNLPIGQLPNWQNSPISGVPGMGQVPMGSFPNPISGSGSTMRIDFVHGPEEAKRLNTISGSDVEGFRVPCKIGKKDCAYIELDDKENEGDEAQSALEGVQWISGKYQEVEGGKGALKLVNGGKEPTGRLPYGDVFKVVVWEPDEKTDTVTTALFTRFCRDSQNCTPYFLGPIPHLTYKRDSDIFVGKVNLGSVPSKSSTPTGAKKGGPMPPPKTYSGGGQACSVDTSKLDGASKSVIAALDPNSQEGAAKYVPLILQSCTKAGITDTDQLAYVLATAELESGYFKTTSEYSEYMYDECGWGEGLIQVTNCDKKADVLKNLGQSPYGGFNDKRLQEPQIAADALCRGLKEGWYGQMRPISDCIGGGKKDYLCARQQVNSNDKWQQIGANADGIAARLAQGDGVAGAKGVSSAVTCQPGTTAAVPCPPGQTCPLLNPLPRMSDAGIYSRFRRCRPNHNGVDMQSTESPGNYDAGIPSGGPVVAPDDGTVVYAANDGSGYANIVKIYHPKRNISTFHAHLNQIKVSQGQQVKRGEQIAVEGGNGINGNLSYGIHLHFEIHQGAATPGDPYGDQLDPENFDYEKPVIPKPGNDSFCNP